MRGNKHSLSLNRIPLASIVWHLKVAAKNVAWLFQTNAPWAAYLGYFTTVPARFEARKYYNDIQQFKQATSSLTFTTDWFSYNIPHWRLLFERFSMLERPLNILEIGSWEGQSSYYLLTALKAARITCVDQWEGVSQQQDYSGEQCFDANLAAYAHRLTKYKGTSFRYYLEHPATPSFDLIYVDGSHHSDDVMIDALQCFARLKPGGIMIFDDYFYNRLPRVKDNAASAIHAFLSLKSGQYRIVHSYCQLVIEKLETN